MKRLLSITAHLYQVVVYAVIVLRQVLVNLVAIIGFLNLGLS